MKTKLPVAIATVLLGAGIGSGQTLPPVPVSGVAPAPRVAPLPALATGTVPDTLPVLPTAPAPGGLLPAVSKGPAAPAAPAQPEEKPPLFPPGVPLYACPDQFLADNPEGGPALNEPPPKHGLFGCAWVSADALFWWVKNAPLPEPLLTTAPTGRALPGTPGTTVLFGGNDINTQGPLYGSRISFGLTDPSYVVGLEFSGFFLSSRSSSFATSSSAAGFPVLSRPYFDTTTGAESGQLVSSPGAFAGTFTSNSSLDLWGAEANVLRQRVLHKWEGATKWCGCCLSTDFLAGFRFMNLNEELGMVQNTTVLPGGVAGFNGMRVTAPGRLSINDQFLTGNYFYGGQVGLQTMLTKGRYFFGLTGKVALGSTYQVSNIVGSTALLGAAGPIATAPGGLYALPSNIGIHSREAFTAIPEVGLNVGVELFKHVRVYGGYNFIYWSDVIRPGGQIDPAITPTQQPSSVTFHPGPAVPERPLATNATTDFFAHGLNAGVAIRY